MVTGRVGADDLLLLPLCRQKTTLSFKGNRSFRDTGHSTDRPSLTAVGGTESPKRANRRTFESPSSTSTYSLIASTRASLIPSSSPPSSQSQSPYHLTLTHSRLPIRHPPSTIPPSQHQPLTSSPKTAAYTTPQKHRQQIPIPAIPRIKPFNTRPKKGREGGKEDKRGKERRTSQLTRQLSNNGITPVQYLNCHMPCPTRASLPGTVIQPALSASCIRGVMRGL